MEALKMQELIIAVRVARCYMNDSFATLYLPKVMMNSRWSHEGTSCLHTLRTIL